MSVVVVPPGDPVLKESLCARLYVGRERKERVGLHGRRGCGNGEEGAAVECLVSHETDGNLDHSRDNSTDATWVFDSKAGTQPLARRSKSGFECLESRSHRSFRALTG